MGRYPWSEILLFQVLHTLVLYPTRQPLHRVVVFATMVCVATQILLNLEVIEPIGMGYAAGFQIALHFGSIAYLLCSEGSFPDHWRRVRDEVNAKADGSSNLPSNFTLAKKLWWMFDIAHNVRMIGWIQEPRDSLPPPPPPSRKTFIRKAFLKLLVSAALQDLLTLMLVQNPVFDPRVHDPTDGPETYLAALPLLRRVPYILTIALSVATPFNISHNIEALMSVGFGLSSPALWPDLFGRFGEAYTLRKFWGYVYRPTLFVPQSLTSNVRRTWHQRMRPVRALVLSFPYRYPDDRVLV